MSSFVQYTDHLSWMVNLLLTLRKNRRRYHASGKISEIRNQLQLNDDKIYFYTIDKDGTKMFRKATDYELLAEEGLKEIYLMEPEGLWEQCLEDYSA